MRTKDLLDAIKGDPQTAEEKLRLQDTTGGIPHKQKCFTCGAEYSGGSNDTGMCPLCSSNIDGNTKAVPGVSLRENEALCLHCAKVYELTPVTGVRDLICPDCRNSAKDTAELRCAKCKVVICRIAPGIMDCGYVIQPNAVLHSDSCNICNPSLNDADGDMTTTIVEVDLWMKNVRRAKTFVHRR